MEQFKDIIGWEGFYQISDLGRVKSVERYVPIKLRSGNIGKWYVPEKIKATTITPTGYEWLRLWNQGHSATYLVHRLVANAFIPNPENKPHINHLDGNPSNNRASNLEWCTASENMCHAFKFLGRKVPNKGLKPHESHLAIKVKSIDKVGVERTFGCIRYAAEYHDVDQSLVSKVCRGIHRDIKGIRFQYL